MTSMPEVIKAPPRPAASSAASSSPPTANDDPQDKDFADLLDKAAGDEAVDDSSSRTSGSKGRPKDSRPDSIAKATVTDTTEPVMMPWLAAPLQPTPPAGGEPTLAPGAVDAAATVTTPDGGAATPLSTAPEAPATLADALVQGASDKAGAGQASTAATPQGAQPAGLPANPALAPQAATPPTTPDASATAQPMAATAAAAIPAATAQAGLPAAPQTAEAAESATDGNTDPRRAGRTGGRAAGRAAPDAGKPDPSAIVQQQAAAGQAARGGQPQANANTAPELPAAAPSSSSGNAASSSFDALPALHGQAATQYAAAASGRVATAHTPVMAQLATPLVRVAEAGGGEFHIDLAPAELGRVRVVADVNNGQVTLSVQAENADTLALLRRDLQQLEKALGDSGLKLDNANLQFSLQGDGQSRGFAAFGQGGGNGGGQGPWRGPAMAEAAAVETLPERAPRPIDGLVDVTI